MKPIFSLLLCYVLMTSQSYALSGGPTTGGSGKINTVGTYAGVLTATVDPGNPQRTDSALGLFTLSVPQTLLATGSFLLFVNGQIFNGSITASIDQDSSAMLGVLQATYSIITSSLVNPTTGTVSTSATIIAGAFGKVTGKVKPSSSNAISSARLAGASSIAVTQYSSGFAGAPGPDVTYTLVGFRQSLTASSSGTTTTLAGTTGG